MAHISSANAWRGAEQQIHLLLNADSGEIENYLFCAAGAALPEKNNTLSNRVGTYHKLFGWDLLGGWKLKKFLLDKQIDIVHIHDSHALNLYWIAYILGVKIPAVYHKHHQHPIKNIRKYDHHALKKIVCVSRSVYDEAAKALDKKKLLIIHPGIQKNIGDTKSHNLRSEFQIPQEAKLAGMVCALEKEKNVFELVEIARQQNINHPPLYFMVIGSGAYENEIHAAIQKAGLEKTFFLAGFRQDVPSILSQLDIFIFSSLSEGFPLAILEAMQAGTPILTRGSGGIKEIVAHNETGWIYHCPEEACQKINWILTHETEKKRIILNAKNFVQQFSAAHMIQKTHTLYKEILT